jgi:hypothetical protein
MPAKKTSSPSPAEQLESFIDKFDTPNQSLIRTTRQVLRKRFPTAHELVYDNYNFFVIGYSPTERPSDSLLSIAAAASGVSICFMWGVKLDNSKKLLTGDGKQTRFLKVPSVDVLKNPDVIDLMAAAESGAKVPMPKSGSGNLVIRSISAKQRPRRKENK